MRSFAIILVLVTWHQCLAQVEPAERNATQQEIVGDWRLLPLPDALEPKILATNPWPSPCQWFAYTSTGVLKSFDQTRLPCDTLSSAQLDQAMLEVPAVMRWRYDLSRVFNKGLVLVTRSDAKGYTEVWNPHTVTKPFSRGGAEFQRGDLLLYLVNMHSKQVVWIRHLRRLQTSAEPARFIMIGDTRFFLAGALPPTHPLVREYIPAGETLENWKQLLAIRVFKRLRDPHAFLDGLGHDAIKRNPGTRYVLVQNEKTKTYLLDLMVFPAPTTKPFYAEWNLWRASYAEGSGLVAYQYARRIYTNGLDGPEFGSIVNAAREQMYDAFATASFVESKDAKQ